MRITDEPPFFLWPQHESVWLAFITIQTQVNRINGRFDGFNYTGVESGWRLAGIKNTPALFDGLQQIEIYIFNFVANS